MAAGLDVGEMTSDACSPEPLDRRWPLRGRELTTLPGRLPFNRGLSPSRPGMLESKASISLCLSRFGLGWAI